MITYIEAQQRTDAFLEKKVQEISELNHSIMGKAHSKEFRWNTRGASLLHLEHIAFVILRDYLVEAVRKGVENTWSDVGNCISDNVLFFILDQANIKMKTKLWNRHLTKAKGDDEELYSSYSSADWFIVGMRFWLDAHPEEKKELGIKNNWDNTTLLRKYIITNLHNPDHPFNDFFNDTDYRTLVDTFCIPYLSPEAENEIIEANASNNVEVASPEINQVPTKEEFAKAIVEAQKPLFNKLSKKIEDKSEAQIRQGGRILETLNDKNNGLNAISSGNRSMEKKIENIKENLDRTWCSDRPPEAKEKETHIQIRYVMDILKDYEKNHPGEIKKVIEGDIAVFTCKKNDRILRSLVDVIEQEKPIEAYPIKKCLKYEMKDGSIEDISLATIKGYIHN